MKFYNVWSLAVLFFAVLVFSQSSLAFINIESLRINNQTGVSGKTNTELTGKTGNTEKTIGSLSSTNIYRWSSHEILGLLDYQYGETTKVKDTNRGSGHFRWTHLLNATYLSSEAFLQSQFNEFQGLERRDLAGGGIRIRLSDSVSHHFFSGVGLFYESELLKMDPRNDDFRGNFYFSYLNTFKKDFELSTIVYYQPQLQNYIDFRLQVQFQIEYKILSFLALVNSVAVSHDSRPPAGVDSNDLSYLAGVSFSY